MFVILNNYEVLYKTIVNKVKTLCLCYAEHFDGKRIM